MGVDICRSFREIKMKIVLFSIFSLSHCFVFQYKEEKPKDCSWSEECLPASQCHSALDNLDLTEERPKICGINVFPLGNGSYPCCDHNDRPRCLFLAWHRPYLKQFELGLQTGGLRTSQGLPYWDWTEGEGVVRLPDLATTEPTWRDGEVPFGNLTTRAQPVITASSLRTKVRTALCQRNYLDFEEQIDEPHNEVHSLVVGGSMGNLVTAAYDPIFYLHHSNVDRYYAYWQALQELRGLGSLTTQILDNSLVNSFTMPPFTSRAVNPFFS